MGSIMPSATLCVCDCVVNGHSFCSLSHRWALWYFKNDKSKSWTENLRLISKFDTVEDFWA